MKRIVITKPFQVEIEEIPIPEIQQANQVLVRTEFSGVSLGTEKIFFDGTWEPNPANYPIYPGYEAVGIVEKCGNGVKSLKPGDRVVTFGNHAGYVLVPEGGPCQKIPHHIKPEKATLAILGATAIHAVERGQITSNSTVAILGAGVLGCLLQQHVKLAGARFVTVCDICEEKLSVAKDLGADLVINPTRQSPAEMLRAASGELADVTYEVAGGASAAQEEALRLTKEYGRVVLMGGGERGIIRFPYRLFFEKELEVRSSRAIGGRWENFAESLSRIATGKVRVDPIPTQIVPYTEIESIYSTLSKGEYRFIHLVLTWS